MAERGIEVDAMAFNRNAGRIDDMALNVSGLQRTTDPEGVLPGLIAHDDPYVSSVKNFKVRSAIRHYLLILMTVGRPQRASGSWEKIAGRVVEIVRLIGFGPRDAGIFLFDSVLYGDEFDLWTVFCSYTNLFSDDLYDEFTERCLSVIPVDQLYVLLERCTAVARTKTIQDAISRKQSPADVKLGLSNLERAFVSAWSSADMEQAEKLLSAARTILAQPRFANQTRPSAENTRNKWLSYEYKWKLMQLLEVWKHNPQRFEEEGNFISLHLSCVRSALRNSTICALLIAPSCGRNRKVSTSRALSVLLSNWPGVTKKPEKAGFSKSTIPTPQ
ncbi:hypothetical protein [Paraburkholderia sp. BL10I2N1]|uniref:hypothetical protein n=1 Tax=Paraburkholderia sp. BL10I2N1 TaxID=1938796 RepID=UPI0010E2AD12|nr:hypothetical protein [Paraburkholderia sp. BL10I2N1]TDN58733.1 hypothetical protein B0G77_7862 [Paraburkholderia sp. BL10I2N1]